MSPTHTWSGHFELQIELRVAHAVEVALYGRARVADLGDPSLDAVLAHEARDAILAHAAAALAQRLVHSRTAVDTSAFGMNRADLQR